MTDWDRLLASSAVNKQASAVTSEVSHFCLDRKGPDNLTSKNPLPRKQVPPDCEDLTGLTLGKLRVVGMLDKNAVQNNAPGARWVVRCVCGVYEARRTKVLKRGDPRDGQCSVCEANQSRLEGHDISRLPHFIEED